MRTMRNCANETHRFPIRSSLVWAMLVMTFLSERWVGRDAECARAAWYQITKTTLNEMIDIMILIE